MRALFVLVIVGSFGCGDDGGGSVAIEDAPALFHEEYCSYLARCGLVPDEASCLDLNDNISLHIDASLIAAVHAGKVKYDGSIIGRCYRSIGAISCDRTAESGRSLGGEECFGGLSGTVDEGGPCAIDEECKSAMCDVPACPDACCQGTCMGPPEPALPRHLGESCMAIGECASGSYCDTSATKTCVALEPADATCVSTTECAYGLGCAGTPRTCRVLPELGEACPDGLCREDGAYCNASKVCAKVGLPGDACASRTDCSALYVCDATMHCALGAHEGEACSTTARCTDDENFCDLTSMTCKAPQPNGSPCTTDSQCESYYCGGTGTARACDVEPVCF